MCLKKITKSYKRVSKTVRSGYKLFNLDEVGNYLFLFRSFQGKREVPVGKWITAELDRGVDMPPESLSTTQDGIEYATGFHTYVHKKDAKAYGGRREQQNEKVVRVKIRFVHTLGIQCGKIAVASEMYVPRPRKTKVNNSPTLIDKPF